MRKGVRVKPATALHIKSLLNSSWDSSSTTYVDEIIDIRLMPGADADAESLIMLHYHYPRDSHLLWFGVKADCNDFSCKRCRLCSIGNSGIKLPRPKAAQNAHNILGDGVYLASKSSTAFLSVPPRTILSLDQMFDHPITGTRRDKPTHDRLVSTLLLCAVDLGNCRILSIPPAQHRVSALRDGLSEMQVDSLGLLARESPPFLSKLMNPQYRSESRLHKGLSSKDSNNDSAPNLSSSEEKLIKELDFEFIDSADAPVNVDKFCVFNPSRVTPLVAVTFSHQILRGGINGTRLCYPTSVRPVHLKVLLDNYKGEQLFAMRFLNDPNTNGNRNILSQTNNNRQRAEATLNTQDSQNFNSTTDNLNEYKPSTPPPTIHEILSSTLGVLSPPPVTTPVNPNTSSQNSPFLYPPNINIPNLKTSFCLENISAMTVLSTPTTIVAKGVSDAIDSKIAKSIIEATQLIPKASFLKNTNSVSLHQISSLCAAAAVPGTELFAEFQRLCQQGDGLTLKMNAISRSRSSTRPISVYGKALSDEIDNSIAAQTTNGPFTLLPSSVIDCAPPLCSPILSWCPCCTLISSLQSKSNAMRLYSKSMVESGPGLLPIHDENIIKVMLKLYSKDISPYIVEESQRVAPMSIQNSPIIPASPNHLTLSSSNSPQSNTRISPLQQQHQQQSVAVSILSPRSAANQAAAAANSKKVSLTRQLSTRSVKRIPPNLLKELHVLTDFIFVSQVPPLWTGKFLRTGSTSRLSCLQFAVPDLVSLFLPSNNLKSVDILTPNVKQTQQLASINKSKTSSDSQVERSLVPPNSYSPSFSSNNGNSLLKKSASLYSKSLGNKMSNDNSPLSTFIASHSQVPSRALTRSAISNSTLPPGTSIATPLSEYKSYIIGEFPFGNKLKSGLKSSGILDLKIRNSSYLEGRRKTDCILAELIYGPKKSSMAQSASSKLLVNAQNGLFDDSDVSKIGYNLGPIQTQNSRLEKGLIDIRTIVRGNTPAKSAVARSLMDSEGVGLTLHDFLRLATRWNEWKKLMRQVLIISKSKYYEKQSNELKKFLMQQKAEIKLLARLQAESVGLAPKLLPFMDRAHSTHPKDNDNENVDSKPFKMNHGNLMVKQDLIMKDTNVSKCLRAFNEAINNSYFDAENISKLAIDCAVAYNKSEALQYGISNPSSKPNSASITSPKQSHHPTPEMHNRSHLLLSRITSNITLHGEAAALESNALMDLLAREAPAFILDARLAVAVAIDTDAVASAVSQSPLPFLENQDNFLKAAAFESSFGDYQKDLHALNVLQVIQSHGVSDAELECLFHYARDVCDAVDETEKCSRNDIALKNAMRSMIAQEERAKIENTPNGGLNRATSKASYHDMEGMTSSKKSDFFSSDRNPGYSSKTSTRNGKHVNVSTKLNKGGDDTTNSKRTQNVANDAGSDLAALLQRLLELDEIQFSSKIDDDSLMKIKSEIMLGNAAISDSYSINMQQKFKFDNVNNPSSPKHNKNINSYPLIPSGNRFASVDLSKIPSRELQPLSATNQEFNHLDDSFSSESPGVVRYPLPLSPPLFNGQDSSRSLRSLGKSGMVSSPLRSDCPSKSVALDRLLSISQPLDTSLISCAVREQQRMLKGLTLSPAQCLDVSGCSHLSEKEENENDTHSVAMTSRRNGEEPSLFFNQTPHRRHSCSSPLTLPLSPTKSALANNNNDNEGTMIVSAPRLPKRAVTLLLAKEDLGPTLDNLLSDNSEAIDAAKTTLGDEQQNYTPTRINHFTSQMQNNSLAMAHEELKMDAHIQQTKNTSPSVHSLHIDIPSEDYDDGITHHHANDDGNHSPLVTPFNQLSLPLIGSVADNFENSLIKSYDNRTPLQIPIIASPSSNTTKLSKPLTPAQALGKLRSKRFQEWCKTGDYTTEIDMEKNFLDDKGDIFSKSRDAGSFLWQRSTSTPSLLPGINEYSGIPSSNFGISSLFGHSMLAGADAPSESQIKAGTQELLASAVKGHFMAGELLKKASNHKILNHPLRINLSTGSLWNLRSFIKGVGKNLSFITAEEERRLSMQRSGEANLKGDKLPSHIRQHTKGGHAHSQLEQVLNSKKRSRRRTINPDTGEFVDDEEEQMIEENISREIEEEHDDLFKAFNDFYGAKASMRVRGGLQKSPSNPSSPIGDSKLAELNAQRLQNPHLIH